MVDVSLSVSSGSASVANKSSQGFNNSKGGTSSKLHCVATDFCSLCLVCVHIYMLCFALIGLPLFFPFRCACGVTAICDTVLNVYWTEGEIEEAVKSTSSLICMDSLLLVDNSSIAIYNYVVFCLYTYIHKIIM